jgi:murein DD-endopeptidase MepM/ murein hydrolase activator NlpD
MIIPTLLMLAALPAVSSNPSADNPEVGVPFACGRIYPVSQGHDTGSHKYNDTYAWDFRMPDGTPVVAAREGVVRMARGDSTEGGCDEKFAPMANYVVVSHGDGMETQYLHFSAVVVTAGEHVKQGQLLGFSGSTGWACGAHLHFKVAKEASRGWNNPSVPARLEGYGDPVRDTRIASPLCRDSRNNVLAAQDPQRTGEALVSLSPAADEAQKSSSGIPAGAKSLIDSLSQPPAQGGEGLRKPQPARAPSGTASARETP